MQLAHFFGLLFCLNFCNGKNYKGHKLYRGIPVTVEHLDFFKNMSKRYDVNFWKDPGQLYMPIEFTIGPKDVHTFEQDADIRKIYLTTVLKDVQEAFNNQTVRRYIRRKMDTFDFRSFFRLKDIYTWLEDLGREFPEELSVFSIGQTVEGRNIMAAKLVHKNSKRRSDVIIEGGIHAREWIAPAFVAYLLNELVRARTSENKGLKEIAYTYIWHFIPVANPDGYEYSHSKDRMWRKNRRGQGIDLNRNFNAAFGSVGVSLKPKSEEYCGSFPFSEPESAALRQYIEQNSKKLEYYIAFHAYGQLFIIPYAFSKSHADNFDEMKKIGKRATTKIARRFGTQYTIGTAYDTVGYMAAGTSPCWVKERFRVPYVATIELRDRGNYGFALPPEQILPTCEETLDGMIGLFQPASVGFSKLPYSTHVGNLHDSTQSFRKNGLLKVFVIFLNIGLVIVVQ